MPNPSLLPAKPSEAGSPGRGGARERTQFSPPGGNGVEWTLRRRAAVGKVTRRPQAAKLPPRKEPSSCPMRASGPTKNPSIIAPSSVTASPCHLPPKGKAFFGGPHPAPLGPLFPKGEGLGGGPVCRPYGKREPFPEKNRGITPPPFSRFSISSF